MQPTEQNREQWGSKLGFILAAAGSAVGLGNIWAFPYVVGSNGGAAFIVVYLLCVAIIGLPVLLAEILLGRTAQRNPVGTFKALSNSKGWHVVGGMGVVAGFVILSFYAVVAGWALGYIFEAIRGVFFDFQTPQDAINHFNSLTGDPVWILGMLLFFMILTMVIVVSGVQKGIEKGSKIMMPLLFILLIGVMIRGVTLEGSSAGLSFLFNPDWSKISGTTVLVALGQAFFTLSLGMGAMMTYGSYMSKKDNVVTSTFQIVTIDTSIALIAGTAIFTAVFAIGLNPSEGVGLIFHTLPIVFSKMTGGYIIAVVFFTLLFIAALTSAISLMEVVTAYFVDEKKWKRKKAVYLLGSLAILAGVPSALSFNWLSEFLIFGMNFFDLMFYITFNIMLPLGGFLIAIFVAWVWGLDKAVVELKKGAEAIFENTPWQISLWKIFLKYFSSVLIFLVLLNSLGLLDPLINLFF
ncbi:MAG: sodium-dependent transporter [Melioribacteraceae bacterium]|nr:sodium-dependent transporter [Melioribacteraceae bacterium]MCF8265600.1 sodium-dependent transporter [Melioribacteraceae bacterium]MCF8431555.1 sodium-dependent transporter [Melioribacteraceae bacterium]